MRITSIRKDGKFLTGLQLETLCSKLQHALTKAGFLTTASIIAKGSINLTDHQATFRIDTNKLGYNARINPFTISNTKAGYKRTNSPTWGQREEFNHLVNKVLDGFKVSANVRAQSFIIRKGTQAVTSWAYPDVYSTGGYMDVPNVLEVVKLAQAEDAVAWHGINAPWIAVGE